MKKDIIKIALFGLTLSGTLVSCSDYLDNVPKGQKIPTSLSDFTTLLADEYTNHREDITQASVLLNDRYVTISYQSYYPLWKANYFWDTSIDRIKENNSDETTYYNGYAAVSTANLILENVDATTATDSEKAIAKAQAKFLRASRYLTLVNYYSKPYQAATAATDGGVPVITSANVSAPYTQLSVQGVYDFIVKDLTEAVVDLPETSLNVLYANKAAGYALLARTYLTMGNYAQALQAADEALSRHDDLFDWTQFYSEHQSIIEQPGVYQANLSPMGHDWVENYYFCNGSNSYSGYEFQVSEWRGQQVEKGDVQFASRFKLRTVGSETYYDRILSGYYNKGGITTTEVWLIKAECLVRTGDIAGGLKILNDVRAKRILASEYHDITASSETEAVKAIIRTKSDALIQTIVPFMDRRRLNLDATTAETLTREEGGKTYSIAPDSYMWTMPFPQGALENSGNGSFTQNVEK